MVSTTRLLLVITLVASLASRAGAVVIAGDYAGVSDAAINITPPPSDPGFYNVGSVGTASAIYLGTDGAGGDWVLTAKHVTLGATTFQFPSPSDASQIVSATYNIVPNSAVILTNPSGLHQGSTSDLIMYKIDPASSPLGAPNLPNLDIATSSPTAASNSYAGDPVLAAGRGTDRAASQTFWDGSLPTWHTTSQAAAVNTGYLLTGPQQIRWGDNLVSQSGSDIVYNVGTVANPIYIHAFTTTFDQYQPNPSDPAHSGTALSYEFQATFGDSGGGVFAYVNGDWVLNGMIDAVTTPTGQPASTVAFGDTTIIADLSFYRSAILAKVPLVGDANGDGVVNGLDISLIASHWLTAGPLGDVNHDGFVNGLDISLVASRWEFGGLISASSGSAAAVPEPPAFVLALLSVLLLGAWWCVRPSRDEPRALNH